MAACKTWACLFYTFRREVRGFTLAQNSGILWGPSTNCCTLMQLASRSATRLVKFDEYVNPICYGQALIQPTGEASEFSCWTWRYTSRCIVFGTRAVRPVR